MTKAVSDTDLVRESLAGNLDAFAELLDRYEQKLLRYILRLANISSSEAEELLQEVFLSAWKNLNDFDQELSFSSWIYRITHHRTISWFRKERSRGRENQVPLDLELYDPPDGELDIPRDLDRQLLAEKVQRVLETLKEDYRDVLVLKYFEDKSYEEISDILQKPSGTVATLLSRAKSHFSTAFQSLS